MITGNLLRCTPLAESSRTKVRSGSPAVVRLVSCPFCHAAWNEVPCISSPKIGFTRVESGSATASLPLSPKFNPNRSLDFGEIARLCHAACFSPSRRRSGLRRGVARSRMRTEAGKMPESLIFLTENSPGVSNDRFGFKDRFWGIQSGADAWHEKKFERGMFCKLLWVR